MEKKELFSYLMDMWAAHLNSCEEVRTVYDAVHDFANAIIIHDKRVYASEQSEDARKSIHEWARAEENVFLELFSRCTGCILKKEGYVVDDDSPKMLDGDIIGNILDDYAEHLREKGIFEDKEYKEKIWNQLQTDPSCFR